MFAQEGPRKEGRVLPRSVNVAARNSQVACYMTLNHSANYSKNKFEKA